MESFNGILSTNSKDKQKFVIVEWTAKPYKSRIQRVFKTQNSWFNVISLEILDISPSETPVFRVFPAKLRILVLSIRNPILVVEKKENRFFLWMRKNLISTLEHTFHTQNQRLAIKTVGFMVKCWAHTQQKPNERGKKVESTFVLK